MSMYKILFIFGTRPEAIKMAPLILEMRKYSDRFQVKICVTAQHRQMLDQVLEIFELVPDFDLNIMKPGQNLTMLTASLLNEVQTVLLSEKPDLVVVHGDTTTTFAAALACFYEDIKVGHVEAGLRTHNLRSPFPEEFNRQVVSKIAALNFAPTEHCRTALLEEHIDPTTITVSGNTVIDALNMILDKLDLNVPMAINAYNNLDSLLPFEWRTEQFILVTGHRRENFGNGFLQICEALSELAREFPKVQFVYPVHLNPNVQIPVLKILSNRDNIHLIEPLDYVTFTALLKNCDLVLTDSGGIQEEAPSLGKPVVLMRESTERPEALTSGNIVLAGPNKENIIREVTRLLIDRSHYMEMSISQNPFGDGHASEKIVAEILRVLENS